MKWHLSLIQIGHKWISLLTNVTGQSHKTERAGNNQTGQPYREESVWPELVLTSPDQTNYYFCELAYHIYLINRLGHLLNFWTLMLDSYSRWILIKFSSFSKSRKFILTQNYKTEDKSRNGCDLS